MGVRNAPRNTLLSIGRRIFPAFVIFLLLISPVLQQSEQAIAMPEQGLIDEAAKTVGGILTKALGVQSMFDSIGEELEGVLDKFHENNTKMIELLSETYKDNLDVTIDSLDEATQRVLRSFEATLNEVNELFKEDVELVAAKATETIEAANEKVQEDILLLEKSLSNLIVIGGETAVYVIDRAIYNTILVIAIVMLAIGLLLFIVLFWKHKLPEGIRGIGAFAFMGVYIVGFSSLTLSPAARTYVMRSTKLGFEAELRKSSEPEVAFVTPSMIVRGQETTTLEIWGRNLLGRDDEPPSITVAGQGATITSANDTEITVQLPDLDFTKLGQWVSVDLVYSDQITKTFPLEIAFLVPNVGGMDVDQAHDTLRNAGFDIGTVVQKPDETIPRGSVINTDPGAGKKATPGQSISVYVSRGRICRVKKIFPHLGSITYQPPQQSGGYVYPWSLSPDFVQTADVEVTVQVFVQDGNLIATVSMEVQQGEIGLGFGIGADVQNPIIASGTTTRNLWKPDNGWQIARLLGDNQSDLQYQDTTNTEDVFDTQASNALVRRYTVKAVGAKIGTGSNIVGVVVEFNPDWRLELRESDNCVTDYLVSVDFVDIKFLPVQGGSPDDDLTPFNGYLQLGLDELTTGQYLDSRGKINTIMPLNLEQQLQKYYAPDERFVVSIGSDVFAFGYCSGGQCECAKGYDVWFFYGWKGEHGIECGIPTPDGTVRPFVLSYLLGVKEQKGE